MTPDLIFQICSGIALLGWITWLISSPFFPDADKFLIGIVITLLAIVYAWIIVTSFNPSDAKKFGSLDGVMILFQNKTLVTAGWVHYLAFDLMVGIWIKRNSLIHDIPNWLIIPCLLFTFMLGPVGLLFYLLIRYIRTGNYFAANYN